MKYPGRVVRKGEPDAAVVKALAKGLAARGYNAPDPAGVYDAGLVALVKLFQAQNADAGGRPLKVDGEVGPMTWGAIFGAPAPVAKASGAAGAALAVAFGEIGVLEQPLGSNGGPRVNQYLASVGLGPGYYWCMAFVHWCFKTAAASGANPFPKTAGCLDAWNRVKASAPARLLTRADAIANPAKVKPGMVFILDYGKGMGHTGFVREVTGAALRTVEGNTNIGGSNNGIGVFELNRRSVMDKNLKGFIDFT